MTTAPHRENPYPGLRPFTEAEAHLFFGRDTLVDEMLLRLDRSRFLGVVGVSGSGKSSLLQAGLVPRLQGDLSSDASGRWRVLTMRPWTDPLGRLARGLARPGLLSMPGADASTPDVIEATLRRSGIGLLKLVAQALPSDARLLIIVDQFEELFRFKGSTLDGRFGDDPAALVALLLETVRGEAPVSVLISMRSDFIGECARFPGLAELMSASQYLVPRMTRDQLAEAITGPAAIEGVTLQPQLVQQLLNDVEDSQDQLPVLQHALMRTWQHWSQSATGAASGGAARAIDFDAYNATGGMARALSAHADQVLADLKDPTEQQAAQRIFRALTDQPPHAHPVRRPLRFGQLVEEVGADSAVVAAVVRHFSGGDRHFLVASDEVLKPGSIVDIAHESLLRLWDTLRGWLEEEQESRRRYAELVSAAERHTKGDLSLWREPELGAARRWVTRAQPDAPWASRYGSRQEYDAAMAFLAGSEAAEARRSRRRTGLWTVGVIAVISLTLLALNLYLSRQRELAVTQENARLAQLVADTQKALDTTLESQRRTANALQEAENTLEKSAESLGSAAAPSLASGRTAAIGSVSSARTAIARALASIHTSAEVYYGQQQDLAKVARAAAPTTGSTGTPTPPTETPGATYAPPPQSALRGYKVGIYLLKGNYAAELRAREIQNALPPESGVSLQLYPSDAALMTRIDALPSDEIRYDANSGDERRAAQALQQKLEEVGAKGFVLRQVATPTPGFISIVLRDGLQKAAQP